MNQTEQNDNSGIVFQDGQTMVTRTKTPKMVDFVMKYSGGLIKNEEQANYVLIVVAVILIIIAITMVSQSSNPVVPANGEVPVGQIVP
jgi:hypothetical protein